MHVHRHINQVRADTLALGVGTGQSPSDDSLRNMEQGAANLQHYFSAPFSKLGGSLQGLSGGFSPQLSS